jgi:2-C-methyl-D-erythritol 2,4-cyclodiphosphate synthase
VGIKAKTPEGMGTDNAAIAHVVVLLIREKRDQDRRSSAADAVPQPEIDRVVNDLVKEVPEQSKVGGKGRR